MININKHNIFNKKVFFEINNKIKDYKKLIFESRERRLKF